MTAELSKSLNRRLFLGGAAALASATALPAMAQSTGSTEMTPPAGGPVRNNVSSFRMLDWQSYFENTKNGAILVDITSRALHYWSEDQSVYRLYPTSVPLSEELTRRGRTEVVEKVVNPSWRPTPSMRERNGLKLSKVGRQTIRWAPALCTLAGPITASTAPMTPARSGVDRRTVVWVCTTNTFRNCSIWQKLARKCCLFDEMTSPATFGVPGPIANHPVN